MKIKFALSKIAQGVFNCDTAMEYLESKDVNVTEELYEDLKKAEQNYLALKHWPLQDDIVGIRGLEANGFSSPDFTGNFRGKTNDRAIVVVNGMNLSVSLDRLFRL